MPMKKTSPTVLVFGIPPSAPAQGDATFSAFTVLGGSTVLSCFRLFIAIVTVWRWCDSSSPWRPSGETASTSISTS